MNEVCTMSDRIIEQLIEEIVGQVAYLYNVGELRPYNSPRL